MKVDALASARTAGTDLATALLDVDTRTAESIASCGEILTEPLTVYGVDTVFGSPGIHTLELMRPIKGAACASCRRAMSRARVSWPTAMRGSADDQASAC